MPVKKKKLAQPATPFWVVGRGYFIRTVTHHLTGKLVGMDDHEILLADAAWIPDDGRFTPAVASGEFSEVEPYPEGAVVAVGRNALIDAVELKAALPRRQK